MTNQQKSRASQQPRKPASIYLVQADIAPDRHQYIPFGVMFVGKALMKAGWNVRLFHLFPGKEQELYQAINQEKPLFLGVSSMIGFSLKWLVKISKDAHRMGVPVVWGGPFASMVPEVVLKEEYIQYVVVGEGEKNTVTLADAIAGGEKPRGVPGVGYMDGEEPHIEPQADVEMNLDLFEPGWELIPLEEYYNFLPGRSERFYQLLFSRGCPYNCSFCYNRIFPQRKIWRTHSLEYFKTQLDYLSRHLPEPVQALGLVADNAFGSPEKGRHLIENIGLPWGAAFRIETVDEEFARWAKETRALYFGFGFESASERMQEIYCRGNNPEQFRKGLELLNGLETMMALGVMFFGPGETLGERQATVELMEELYVLNKRVILTPNSFFAQPKTPLWDKCLEQGYNPPEGLEDWSVNYLDFMRVHNWTPRKWARVLTACQLLYGKTLSSNPLKPDG